MTKLTKSGRTRAAILSAARQLFTENGYDRTTVRDIAAAANIDPAMVIRYFGSKDNLFAQAAEFDLRLPDLRQADPSTIGEILVGHFLELWEGGSESSGFPILLRSAASNEFAAAKMREIFVKQVQPALKRGGHPNAAERAAFVSSQLLGLALCRYVLKLPPLASMRQDKIIQAVGRTIQGYITDP